MTRECDVKGRQGFTLMELLVVLLIIGILSTVALRTIDATRNRSLFDQTTKEMNQLIQAIVGNPDLAYDGRRVDFGYYGDMEKLPDSLPELVRNTSGSAAWRGPYYKLMSAGDLVSYLYDEWGHLYTYRPHLSEIYSLGVNGLDMTVKIADDMAQLNNNIISGSFLDSDDNPPGAAGNSYEVRLYWNNPDAHATPNPLYAVVNPAPGGYYEIALHPSDPIWPRIEVPIGVKKLQAIIPDKETLTRYVAIAPRSRVVADFKFTKLFSSKLTIIGQPTVGIGGSDFLIEIVNEGTDSVSIDSLRFLSTSAPVFLRSYRIGVQSPVTLGPGDLGIGPNGSISFPRVTIAPNKSQKVELYFADFRSGPLNGDPSALVGGRIFRIRFSDGSQIEFTVP